MVLPKNLSFSHAEARARLVLDIPVILQSPTNQEMHSGTMPWFNSDFRRTRGAVAALPPRAHVWYG